MLKVHELSTTSVPGSAGPTGLSERWLTDGLARWVRMVEPTPEELEAALRDLTPPEDFLAPPQEGGSQPLVVVQESATFVIIPVPRRGDAGTCEIRIIWTPSALLTIENERQGIVDEIAADLHRPAGSTTVVPELLVDVLQAIVRAMGPLYLALRRDIESLGMAIEDHPLDVPSTALLAMRHRVVWLSMLWEDQSYCNIELDRQLARVAEFDGVRESLRDLVSGSERGMTLVARMESRLKELREHHERSLQEQTNRRLNLLAILSSIYMPATLIAGIYGMNFERIPVTEIPYGYLIVMTMMAAVVFGQFWYFTRRGWFK
jgi:Mg2+ and Co2+ transporter CorA